MFPLHMSLNVIGEWEISAVCVLNSTGDHLRQMHKNCREGVRARFVKGFRSNGPDGIVRRILTEIGFDSKASGTLPRSAITHSNASPMWSCGQSDPEPGDESWLTGAVAATAISGALAAVAVNSEFKAGGDAVALRLLPRSPHSPAMARRPHMRRTRKADA